MRVVSEKLEAENSWVLEKQQVLYAVCHNIGSLATAFLSDRRQPEVDFLHHWAVVWFKLSGKSSLLEKRKLTI